MATLLSCQPPPPPGYVTVLEHECQFLSRPDEEEGARGEGPEERRGAMAASMSLQASQRLLAIAGVKVALLPAARVCGWGRGRGGNSKKTVSMFYTEQHVLVLSIAHVIEEEERLEL